MGRLSKRFREIATKVDVSKTYSIREAIEVLKGCPAVKFDQSMELSLKLGIDPRKSDQQVRGTVSLPNGTGQKIVLVVFAKEDVAKEALEVGADYAGEEELLAKVRQGWTDFNAVITTPDMMREVGKLGKILGPRGLMPTPKAGTVTKDVVNAVKEIKAGKVEFKADRNGGMHNPVGKLSFSVDQLEDNAKTLLNAVMRAKPASAKGQYVHSFHLSSTMGPGLKIDFRELPTS